MYGFSLRTHVPVCLAVYHGADATLATQQQVSFKKRHPPLGAEIRWALLLLAKLPLLERCDRVPVVDVGTGMRESLLAKSCGPTRSVACALLLGSRRCPCGRWP